LDICLPVLHRIRPPERFFEIKSVRSPVRGAPLDAAACILACIFVDINKLAPQCRQNRRRFREISNDLQAPPRCGATNRLVLPRHVIASIFAVDVFVWPSRLSVCSNLVVRATFVETNQPNSGQQIVTRLYLFIATNNYFSERGDYLEFLMVKPQREAGCRNEDRPNRE